MYKTRCHQELFSFLNHLSLHTNKTKKTTFRCLCKDLQKSTVSLLYHHSEKNLHFLQIPPWRIHPKNSSFWRLHSCCPRETDPPWTLNQCMLCYGKHRCCLVPPGKRNRSKICLKKGKPTKATDLKRHVEIHSIYRRWEIWSVSSLWKQKQREAISPRNI